MNILSYNYTRIPFLILPYIDKDIAVPKELMYDENTKKLYVRSLDGLSDIEIGKSYIEEIIDIEIGIIKGLVSEDGNTFEKLVNIYDQLMLWKNTIVNSPTEDIVSDLSDIIDKFRGLEENDPTLLTLIKSKVDKVIGKGLSTNDFNNELLAKLNSIDNNANMYEHPKNIQCSYKAPVLTVNNRTGDIEITKEELGFANVQEGAIRYEHPSSKQCDVVGISSLNGKTGIVTVDKALIGLSNVQNADIATDMDSIKYCTDKYLTPYVSQAMLSKVINLLYPNINRMYLPSYILEEFIPQPPQFLGLVTNIITVENLESSLGISNIGNSKRSGDLPFLLFKVDNKYIYISNYVIRTNISYNHLSSKGIVKYLSQGRDPDAQGKQITINGKLGKCRVMMGANGNPASGYSGGKYIGGEWDNLVIKFAKSLVMDIYVRAWCQEASSSWDAQAGDVIVRSEQPHNVGYTWHFSKSTTSDSIGFRPVLEFDELL